MVVNVELLGYGNRLVEEGIGSDGKFQRYSKFEQQCGYRSHHPMDHNEAIRRFTERHFILETILQQGCGIGRKFRRAPYPKYAEKVWRAGVIKVDLHGHGEMEERKLRIDKMPLDQMYVVTKDENGTKYLAISKMPKQPLAPETKSRTPKRTVCWSAPNSQFRPL